MKNNPLFNLILRGGGVLLLLLILLSCNSGPDSHTVTFNLDGGRFPNGYETTVAIADGGTLSDIPEPVKDSTSSYRYTFDGWYTDESFKNEYDVTLPVTGDITIYAKWNRYSISHTKTYTVTFTIDDEVVATQTVKEGELATEPEGLGKKDDTNPSYSIVHYVTEWKREGEASAFTFDTPIIEDIILVGTYDSTAPSGYEVNDAAGLRAWAEAIKSNNALACVLLDDIVLEGGPGNWTPVDFGGTFDGQGHKISNVNINTSSAEEHSGFFAELTSGAIVKNVM